MTRSTALDKDLKKFSQLDKARSRLDRQYLRLTLAAAFLLAILFVMTIGQGSGTTNMLVAAAAVIGGYMAMNIGANDVANNVGAAVGSGALTLGAALMIAAVMEVAGAMIAGADVVRTVSEGIIDPALIGEPRVFVWAMMASLLAAAVWVNLATWLSAPVSTTHSIVGGVVGAGIAAAGTDAVDWNTMTRVIASWVISPVMGGLIAAALLAAVEFLVIFRDDKVAAARRWVPVLVAVMSAAFTVYLVMKGLKHVYHPSPAMLVLIGLAMLALSYAVVRPMVARASVGMENRRRSVSRLFTIPLICSAALLSFAHGANDVANAIGPLSAIARTAVANTITGSVQVPLWILGLGAVGIAIGLGLYGPRLIRTVGEKITKLDRARAFCIALSAALTVIVASGLGLPVSSTHVAIGAIFGVGFFRELLQALGANGSRRRRPADEMPPLAQPADPDDAAAMPPASARFVPLEKLAKRERKARKRRLVRRRYVLSIAAAWVITVPFAGVLSAMLYYMLRGMLLP